MNIHTSMTSYDPSQVHARARRASDQVGPDDPRYADLVSRGDKRFHGTDAYHSSERNDTMWKTIRLSILGLASAIAGALVYGSFRWQSATTAMHATLEAHGCPSRQRPIARMN